MWNHWFSLTWAQPQTISRVFLSNQQLWNYFGQTIQGIQYYNLNTHSYVTIPNTYTTAFGGPGNPVYADFTFPPVQTTGVVVLLNTGPLRGHPNWAVMIEEIEVYGSQATGSLKIASPTTGDVFSSNENINFVGSETGTVTSIEWVENGVVFAQGISASKSDLGPGTHTITLRGLSAGTPVSDSITIFVIKSIKIKDLDTGQSPVEPFKMSSIRGIKKFQAIACFDDAGNIEFKPVKVKWSLPDGDLDPAHTMRSQILTALNSNVGKIGVLSTQNSTTTVILDSDTATFVSYFSGNITLKAEFRANETHSVAPKALAIGLKQPTVYVKFNLVANVAPILSLWLSRADQIWGKEDIIKVKNRATETKSNEFLAGIDALSNEIFLQNLPRPEVPSLVNPIALDFRLNGFLGRNYVVPRQSTKLLKRDFSSTDVFAYVVDITYISDPIPSVQPLIDRPGATICRDDYFRRVDLIRISDPSESGIILKNKRSNTGFYPEDERRTLAHELGHILLQIGFEHVSGNTYPTNLMTWNADGDDLTVNQFKIALDFDKAKPADSYFIVEE